MKSPFAFRLFSTACLFAALQTHAGAATLTTSLVNFTSGDISVSDPYSTNSGATTQTNVSAASPALAQFDAATGVLTGATITIDSTRVQTIGGSASRTTSGYKIATFYGTSNANITAPGVNHTFTSITRTETCDMPNKTNTCSYGPDSTITDTDLNAATSALSSYVGAGTISTTLSLPQLQTNLTADTTLTGGNSTYTLNWSGTIAATYTYLLHAAPSFDGSSLQNSLTLDFGTVYQNDSVGPVGFSLFNPAGDRTGVNLTGISGIGDTSIFGTDLSLFANLLQGDSAAYNALFDTSTLGAFGATYTLDLADYMPDGSASSTQQYYSLQLNLAGNVIAAPEGTSTVPIPPSAWLLMSGLAGIAAVSRRRTVA
jgi:hypothetical protein